MEEERRTLILEMEKVRETALSAQVMAEVYRDFPAMLDELRAAGERHALKDLIGRFVEVLEWHQDPDDPSTGTVEIMLFEQGKPADGVCTKKHPEDTAGYRGASGCNERLPERNTPQNPLRKSRAIFRDKLLLCNNLWR